MSVATKNVRFSIDTFDESQQSAADPNPNPALETQWIDDEVKDHPVFTQQNKSPLLRDIQEQLRVNPRCTIIKNIETGKNMTRFGSRYWNLLLSMGGDSATRFMNSEREEYKRQFQKK